MKQKKDYSVIVPILLGLAFILNISNIPEQYTSIVFTISIISFSGLVVSVFYFPKKGKDKIFHNKRGYKVKPVVVIFMYILAFVGMVGFVLEYSNQIDMIDKQIFVLTSFVAGIIGYGIRR